MFNVSPTCYTSLLLNTIGTTHAYVDNIHILCLHAVMVSVWAMSIYAGVCDVSECKEKRNCRAVQLFFSTIAAHREQHRAGEQHNDNYNHVVYCLLAAHIIFFSFIIIIIIFLLCFRLGTESMYGKALLHVSVSRSSMVDNIHMLLGGCCCFCSLNSQSDCSARTHIVIIIINGSSWRSVATEKQQKKKLQFRF